MENKDIQSLLNFDRTGNDSSIIKGNINAYNRFNQALGLIFKTEFKKQIFEAMELNKGITSAMSQSMVDLNKLHESLIKFNDIKILLNEASSDNDVNSVVKLLSDWGVIDKDNTLDKDKLTQELDNAINVYMTSNNLTKSTTTDDNKVRRIYKNIFANKIHNDADYKTYEKKMFYMLYPFVDGTSRKSKTHNYNKFIKSLRSSNYDIDNSQIISIDANAFSNIKKKCLIHLSQMPPSDKITKNGPNYIANVTNPTATGTREQQSTEADRPIDTLTLIISFRCQGNDYTDIVKYSFSGKGNTKLGRVKTYSSTACQIFTEKFYSEYMDKWIFGVSRELVSKKGSLYKKTIAGKLDNINDSVEGSRTAARLSMIGAIINEFKSGLAKMILMFLTDANNVGQPFAKQLTSGDIFSKIQKLIKSKSEIKFDKNYIDIYDELISKKANLDDVQKSKMIAKIDQNKDSIISAGTLIGNDVNNVLVKNNIIKNGVDELAKYINIQKDEVADKLISKEDMTNNIQNKYKSILKNIIMHYFNNTGDEYKKAADIIDGNEETNSIALGKIKKLIDGELIINNTSASFLKFKDNDPNTIKYNAIFDDVYDELYKTYVRKKFANIDTLSQQYEYMKSYIKNNDEIKFINPYGKPDESYNDDDNINQIRTYIMYLLYCDANPKYTNKPLSLLSVMDGATIDATSSLQVGTPINQHIYNTSSVNYMNDNDRLLVENIKYDYSRIRFKDILMS